MPNRLVIRNLHVASAALVCAALLWSSSVEAQRPLQQVLDLNRQGMDHYNNLEIEEALEKLERAVQIAQQSNVTGAPLARTYMSLGVVQVGGMQDNAAGLDAFVRAIQADPDVRLDPLTSTPEVTTVFNMARRQAGEGPGPGPDPDPDPVDPTPAPDQGNIPHTPVEEQLTQTAIPVWIDVPDDAPVGSVQLFFKGTGMREFRRVLMERMSGGFGFEIPCADVFAPSLQYYLVAYDESDTPLGYSGTADRPISVRIVSTRSQPPPALPGRAPPEQCTDTECPPDMPGCNGGGQTCLSSSECPTGFSCVDDMCTSDDDEDDSRSDTREEAPRFFFHAMGFWGSAFASSGMLADSAPANEMNMNDGYLRFDEADCNAEFDTDYCVRIETSGFVPTFGLRLAVGYYFLPRLAAAFAFRWQPNAGEGTLAGLLLGLRLQYLLTEPAPDGFNAAAFVGTSFGQIQPQPSQNGTGEEPEPYVRSGLNGIQLGTVLGYRIMKNFGIQVTPEIMFQLPLFLFNIDLTLGIEVGF
jgi:hypothetical protein